MQSFRQYQVLRQRVNSELAHSSTENAESPPLVANRERGAIPGSDEKPSEHHIIVEWESPDDPLNPRNWSQARRLSALLIIWINVFAVDWASSADSQTASKITKEFHVSDEAETLSPALYTLGVAVGSLFAGPISETVGRNPIYVGSRIVHVAWLLGVALAPNFGAKCAFRFLAGLGGSTLLCIHGASVADLYNPIERTWAFPVISLASFAGTALSPLVGGWIDQSSLSWRWTEWISLILSGSTLFLSLFFLPETFAPVLLSWKAAHLRTATGNINYVSYQNLQASLALRFKTALLRAWHMLVKEPIVVLLGIWLIVVYIVIYGFLQGFSFVFGDTYGFQRGLIGTCFLAIVAGFMLFVCLIPIYNKQYKSKVIELEQLNGDAFDPTEKHIPGYDIPEPEYRLWQAVVVAPALPICLFWLGFTNVNTISVWSSLGAVTLFGFCWAGIYIVVYEYILDVYGIYAGSALAIITFFRYLFSCIINLISRPMYDGLTVRWTMTMLGCIAALLAFAPLFFFWKGPSLRKRSRFAGRYARSMHDRRQLGRALSWS